MIKEASVKDTEEKRKLIDYAAKWWAGQILLMKAAHLSREEDDNPFSRRLAEMAKKYVTDENLDKFVLYFNSYADHNRNACKARLDVDYEPNCLFLRECFDYAGIKPFFFAPKKTRTSLNIEQGFFAYRMEDDKEWTIRAKTNYCDTKFEDYFDSYKCNLYELEDKNV